MIILIRKFYQIIYFNLFNLRKFNEINIHFKDVVLSLWNFGRTLFEWQLWKFYESMRCSKWFK